jgi:outer membrane immunogenic protein
MKKLAFAAAVLAIAGPAWGADYPVKAPAYAPPPPPAYPVYDWSGIYIGANGGGAWGDTSWNFPVTQSFAPAHSVFSTSPKGSLAGGQIGINRQTGPWLFGFPWVWGVEFTGDWANLKETLIGPIPAFPLDAWTTKLTDLETLTVRFGVPVNNWLFYGKAGGATGTINLHAVSGPAGVTFDNTDRAWGTTVGAGIEYGLTQNLILGVEWDFVRLSPGSFNGVASNGKTVAIGANSSFDVQSVVGRLSYKFWTPAF